MSCSQPQIILDHHMARQSMFFILVVFAVLLAACAPASQASTPTPTTTPYDGSWQRQGTAQDGRAVTVKFAVQGGLITWFVYSYPRPDNLFSCTGIDHPISANTLQPQISNGSFFQTFGADLMASGSLASQNNVTGNISTVWQGRSTDRCDANLQAAWTTTKQEPIAQTTAVAPATAAVVREARCALAARGLHWHGA
jgi:hypothetical protein